MSKVMTGVARGRNRGWVLAAMLGVLVLPGWRGGCQGGAAASPESDVRAAVFLSADSARTPAQLRADLRRFRVVGTVLHVGAHPDDENTQLIAYLAHGRAFRTAYLSVTRGDGGQNLLGPELGPLLGVARTQELLAARRIDGGRQFFTRAIDYGFSKDYREALGTWGHEQVLGDVVRVIREFRPDVIVTRFSPQPGGTHGHHTASAVLALEAFRLAGDSTAYPEQLRTLATWQPRRIFVNAGASGSPPAATAVVQVSIDGDDPVLGRPFGAVAAASRGMHKTQGFGQAPFGPGGPGGGRGPRAENFLLLAGDPAAGDIMAGVDTTWSRIPGGDAIGRLASAALDAFDADNPSATVPALLQIRRELAQLASSPLLAEKRVLLDSLIQGCLGLTVESTVPRPEVLAGETLRLHHVARQSSPLAVRWIETRYPDGATAAAGAHRLETNAAVTRAGTYTLPATTPPTQPYWLGQQAAPGFYTVTVDSLIGRPENPPVLPIEHVFEVNGERFAVADRPVAGANGSAREVVVLAPVSLDIDPAVAVLRPGDERDLSVRVTAARANDSGTVRLAAPAGWSITPATQPFRLAQPGDTVRVRFSLRAPAQAAEGEVHAVASVAGSTSGHELVEIAYDHIPRQVLQPDAGLRVVSVQFATRGQSVGYLPGAGDDVPDALRQMGFDVTELAGTDLTPAGLARFDAVVLGIRVANVRTDLETVQPALAAYARAGGTVIEQYTQTGRTGNTALAPFPITISRDRVTEEHAPVTFLAPDHPVLNVPNRITAADFSGWVQEQGTYYAGQWDERFTPILASADTGEEPLRGGLLVAPYGQGYWVYTGLAFFRQLPAGVPGAYRLFANLVALGN